MFRWWERGSLREEAGDVEDFAGGGAGEHDDADDDFEFDEPEPEAKESPDDKVEDKGGKKSDKGGGDVEQLRRRVAELEESERYWADQAKTKSGGGREVAESDEDEDEPDTGSTKDLVDEFSEKGMEALVKRGVLTKSQARDMIRQEAAKIVREEVGRNNAQLSRDAQLVAEFPDLAKADSDLAKRTAKTLQEMVAEDPNLKRSPVALRMAAKAAAAELRAESARGEERESRIRRQAGDGARSGSGARDYDGSGDISPLTARFMGMMGVKQEQFQASKERLGIGRSRR